MRLSSIHIILSILILLQLAGCIEEFDPDLEEGVAKTIVVEGDLTSEPGSAIVRISYLDRYKNGRTFAQDTSPVSLAIVYILDSDGNTVIFEENTAGVYKPVDSMYYGSAGKQYQLNIDLADGKHYESNIVTMPEKVDIDSIYAVRETRTVESVNEYERVLEGMQIYINTSAGKNKKHYLQYDYEETWKQANWGSLWYKIYREQKYSGLYPPRIFPEWPYDTILPDYCFRNYRPKRYLNIDGSSPENAGNIQNKAIVFVPFKDPRLSIRYSIQVRQFSLSYDAWEYWKNVELQSQYTGSFYDPLPSRIYSNLHDPEDEVEVVAGFFFVRNVTAKRIFISNDEIPVLITYPSGCIEYEIWADNPWGNGNAMGWPDLFRDNSPCCFDCRLCSDMTDKVPVFWVE